MTIQERLDPAVNALTWMASVARTVHSGHTFAVVAAFPVCTA